MHSLWKKLISALQKQVSGIFLRQVIQVRNKNIRKKKTSLVLDGCPAHLGNDTTESRDSREAASEKRLVVREPWTSFAQGLGGRSPRKNYNSQKSRAQGAGPTACGRALQSKLWTSPARNFSRSGGSGGYGSTGRERGAGDGREWGFMASWKRHLWHTLPARRCPGRTMFTFFLLPTLLLHLESRLQGLRAPLCLNPRERAFPFLPGALLASTQAWRAVEEPLGTRFLSADWSGTSESKPVFQPSLTVHRCFLVGFSHLTCFLIQHPNSRCLCVQWGFWCVQGNSFFRLCAYNNALAPSY